MSAASKQISGAGQRELREPPCSAVLELAKRIPFKMTFHMSGAKEHALMHRNEELNIQRELITAYRNGRPGKARRYYYVNEKGSTIYDTLAELLEALPLVRQLAEATYPQNSEVR